MEIIRDRRDVTLEGARTVVTVGNFDGVHLGHQRLLTRLVEESAERGQPSVAVTFEPHPIKVLAPKRAVPLITPYAEKLGIFDRFGVDIALVLRFTRAFSETDSAAFIREILSNALHASHVLVGPDSRFGRDRGGDIEELRRAGETYGFTAEAIEPVTIDGLAVSSTVIRRLVQAGSVGPAGRLLGRYHRLRGEIVRGSRRGRLIGFPTANLSSSDELVPANGVYAGRLWLGTESYDAVINVGLKPTFGGRHRTIEAHLLGFDGDLYGEHAALDFIHRLREERRFHNAEELSEQISKDIVSARDALRERA